MNARLQHLRAQPVPPRNGKHTRSGSCYVGALDPTHRILPVEEAIPEGRRIAPPSRHGIMTFDRPQDCGEVWLLMNAGRVVPIDWDGVSAVDWREIKVPY
jgi:hypothetical protein